MSLDEIGMGDGPGTSDTLGNPGHRPRRRKWMRIMLIASALILVAGILFIIIAPQVQKAHLNRTMPKQAQAAREEALPAFENSLGATRGPVGSMLDDQRPNKSLTYSMCWTEPKGVLADSFHYNCQFTTLDFYELPDDVALTPQAGPAGDPRYGLTYPDALAKATGKPVAPNLPSMMFVTDQAANTDEVADSWMLTESLPSHAASDAFDTKELVAGSASELDPGRRLLVLRHTQPYFDQDIGCRAGVPLFCNSPM